MRELWGSPDIWNTKKSYVEIAAKLGVDEETVRNRVKHLRDSGFLLGYRLVPNPDLLGRTFASLRIEFKDRESKQAAIPLLSKVEGVMNIGSTYDKSVLVTLFAGEDQDFSKLLVALGVEGEISSVPGLGLRTTNFAQGNDILEWVKQQPGVRSVTMTIAERVVQVFDWIESEVKRQVRTIPIQEPSSGRKMRETIGIRN